MSELLQEDVLTIKARYEHELMGKKNVIGVGVGYRQISGELTEQLALTVLVRKKLPRWRLRRKDIIPTELDGVPVDVQQVGTFRA